MKDDVIIVETSPRDGLPSLPGGNSTQGKVSFINQLAETGLKKMECVAFVHPRDVPENADAEKVVGGIEKKAGVCYAGLIQTEVGCRRALDTGIDEIVTIVAASDIYNRAFRGISLKQTINNTLPAIFDATRQANKTIRIYLATVFGCPYTGDVPYTDIELMVLKLAHMGASEIVLVDSSGMANPKQVKEIIEGILGLSLKLPIAVHFHNNRGLAIANCFAAFEMGIRIFDASLGGMSKSPFATAELPLGYWNVPTEDLVNMFEGMGIKTGININLLLECVRTAEKYAQAPLPGHILRATQASRSYNTSDGLKILS
ncbi:MAG: hypothetical protein PHN75_12065 [Syntrophales bacterium]|nr:hypothetical protein [Syntrophales bacterium]